MRSRLTIEMQPQGESGPVLGNLTDLSLGGCYVETSAILPAGTRLKLLFSIDNGTLQAEGTVVRLSPGSGLAIRFLESNREGQDNMRRILEFVHNTTMFYDNRYFAKLLKR